MINEVSSARGDKDTMILSAQSYASKLLPDTRGQAKGKIEKAYGKAAQIRSEASIRTAHFQSLYSAQKTPQAIRTQLRKRVGKRSLAQPQYCNLQHTPRPQPFSTSLNPRRKYPSNGA